MSKSTGQWIGTIVGAIVGAFIPGSYVMLGASIGGMIGGVIDPPKGPNVVGPRLNDLSVQTASYGTPIPRVHGTVALHGNVIWVENDKIKEVETKSSSGGKGGGGGKSQVTTYSYYGTFAVGLCLGPVDSISKLWVGGKLVYDSTDTSYGSILSSAQVMGGTSAYLSGYSTSVGSTIITGITGDLFTLYFGTDAQDPDPRMQATLGVNNTPAYRGLAYIVFKDWPLKDYGNSLMGCQVKAEIIANGTTIPPRVVWSIGNYHQSSRRIFGDNFGILTSQFFYGTGFNGSPPWPTIPSGQGNYIGANNGPFGLNFSNGILTAYKSAWPTGGNTLPYTREYIWKIEIDYNGNKISESVTDMGVGRTTCLGPNYWGYLGKLGKTEIYLHDEGAYFDIPYSNTRINRTGSATTDIISAACDPDGSKLFIIGKNSGLGYISIYDINGQLQSTQPFPFLNGWTMAGVELSIQGYSQVFTVEKGGEYIWIGLSYGGSVNCFKIDSTGSPISECSFTAGSGATQHSLFNTNFSLIAEGGIAILLDNSGGMTVFSRLRNTTSNTIPLSQIVEAECLLSGILQSSDLDVTDLTDAVRGYTVASIGPIRNALEPIQAAWPFDIVQDGYKVKFIRRGNSAVATVLESELAAIPGSPTSEDKAAVRITHNREMDTQLPRRVTIKYFDPNREYDVGSGTGAERLNTDAVNELQIDLPIVLIPDEAVKIEETLLYMYWLERHDISFILPPTYQQLQPADVINITTSTINYNLRLVSVAYLPDGRLECSAKFNNAAIYTSTALGSTPLANVPALSSIPGPTVFSLLDIPCIDSSIMNSLGYIGASSGYFNSWPGSYLFSTNDGGQTWNTVQGFQPPGDVIGTATNYISTGTTHIMDMSSILNIRIYSGTLSSVTDITLQNGANHFAYGSDGRWEIIAAQYCTIQSDGTYNLTGLMRGRFGTEQYMNTHVAGDLVVLLDPKNIQFININTSSLNMATTYRCVTSGDDINSVSDTSFTCRGVNMECLAPCDINGYVNTTNDWIISWIPRSRTPVETFSGLATPIGEASELYEIEIWNETFTVLKRTVTSLTSPTFTYTSAMQTTDFGVASKHVIGFRVYQVSALMARGYPASKLLDKFNSTNAPISDISVLLRLDVDTQFVDLKGNVVSTNGNTIVTADPWGGTLGSLYCNDSLSVWTGINNASPVNFGIEDFTVEFWLNLVTNTVSSYPCILTTDVWNGNTGFAIYANGVNTAWGSSGYIFINSSTGISGAPSTLYSTSIIRNAGWKFIEFNRSKTTLRLFVDGILENTVSSATIINYPGSFLSIFGSYATYKADPDKGSIRDLRITKKVARHTSNYIPPTKPLPSS